MIDRTQVEALCRVLGYDPKQVCRIVVEPEKVAVDWVHLDDAGHPRMRRDAEGRKFEFDTETTIHEVG